MSNFPAPKDTEGSFYQLAPFIEALEEFRGIYGDMTISQAVVLATVAASPGLSQKELVQRSGLKDSSISRIYAIMSDRGNRGTGPFNLMALKEDPTDYRVKRVYLTKSGNNLFRIILQHLGKYSGSSRKE